MIVSLRTDYRIFRSLLVQSLAAGISLLLLSYIHHVGTVLQSVYPRINNQPMREDLTWLLGEEWYTEKNE